MTTISIENNNNTQRTINNPLVNIEDVIIESGLDYMYIKKSHTICLLLLITLFIIFTCISKPFNHSFNTLNFYLTNKDTQISTNPFGKSLSLSTMDNMETNYQELCSPLTYPRPLFVPFENITLYTTNTPNNSVYDKFLYYNSIPSQFAVQSVVSSHSAHSIILHIEPYISKGKNMTKEDQRKMAVDLFNNKNINSNLWNKQYLCVFYVFGININDTKIFIALSEPTIHPNYQTKRSKDYHLNIICNISSHKFQSLRNHILATSQTTNIGLYIFNESNISMHSNDSIHSFIINKKYFDLLIPVCSSIILQNILPLNLQNKTESILQKLPILKTDFKIESKPKKKHNYSICTLLHAQRSTKFVNETQTKFLLQEWIEYHIIAGFDHIYIYHHLWNDKQNDLKINNIIIETINTFNQYYNESIITYIPWYIGFIQETKIWWFQNSQLMDCIKRFEFDSQWILYMDIDEFVIPKYHLLDTYDNKHIKVSHLLNNIIDNNVDSYYYIPIDRYDGIPQELVYSNLSSSCDIKYGSYLQRQSCVFGDISKKKVPKSLIKPGDIYDMYSVHRPGISIKGKKLSAISPEKLFILHVSDHNLDIYNGKQILKVNESVCNKSVRTLDVKQAIKVFNQLSVIHHPKSIVPAVLDSKSYKYCYQM